MLPRLSEAPTSTPPRVTGHRRARSESQSPRQAQGHQSKHVKVEAPGVAFPNDVWDRPFSGAAAQLIVDLETIVAVPIAGHWVKFDRIREAVSWGDIVARFHITVTLDDKGVQTHHLYMTLFEGLVSAFALRCSPSLELACWNEDNPARRPRWVERGQETRAFMLLSYAQAATVVGSVIKIACNMMQSADMHSWLNRLNLMSRFQNHLAQAIKAAYPDSRWMPACLSEFKREDGQLQKHVLAQYLIIADTASPIYDIVTNFAGWGFETWVIDQVDMEVERAIGTINPKFRPKRPVYSSEEESTPERNRIMDPWEYEEISDGDKDSGGED